MKQTHPALTVLTVILLGIACATAQQAPENSTQSSAKPTKVVESITVTAPGEIRTEQTVSEATLQEAAPGTSPIRIISQLPSVNYTSADPYGAYEWAVRISVRGFNQNQLGFTLDDIPLGDMSYGNWNGLHISRAIMDENLGRVVLSQGTGALETASNSNLGGTVQFLSSDPSDRRSVTVDQSFGSFNAFRTVGRYESGLLGGKTKFYITGVSQLTDKWKGSGDIGQNYWQLNGKIVHYFKKGVLTAYFDYSNRHETDYQDLSKAYVQYLGYNWDNYGNWGKSVQAANACAGVGSYPGAVANTALVPYDQCDAAYYAGAGIRKDTLGYISYKAALTDKLTWKTTLYGHGNTGVGLWFAPTAEWGADYYNQVMALTGSPIWMRTSEYGIQRGGFITSLAYETGRNRLEGGVWYERENFDLARRFYLTGAASPNQSLDELPSNPFATQWSYDFTSNVAQFHVQDQFKATKALTLSAGFKTAYTMLDGKLGAYTGSASDYAQGSLTAGKPVLPQFGANYKLDKNNEFFGDAAYNVRTYQAGGYSFGASPWGAVESDFQGLQHTLKPETSWTEEIGYRYTSPKASVEASYFHVNFSNRLLAIDSGISGAPTKLSNAGGVATDGVDVAATVSLPSGFSLYNSVTWNHSTYSDDVSAYLRDYGFHLKGKYIVDTPEFMYKTQLGYRNKGFFSNIGADYVSKRYYSYDNTGSVDGRFLSDFAAGYKREEMGPLQDMKFQLSVYNLFGEKYYSSIGTNGFAPTDPYGGADTLQVGSPRTFVGSLSVRF